MIDVGKETDYKIMISAAIARPFVTNIHAIAGFIMPGTGRDSDDIVQAMGGNLAKS